MSIGAKDHPAHIPHGLMLVRNRTLLPRPRIPYAVDPSRSDSGPVTQVQARLRVYVGHSPFLGHWTPTGTDGLSPEESVCWALPGSMAGGMRGPCLSHPRTLPALAIIPELEAPAGGTIIRSPCHVS
ncbi:hypothetical protein Psi02_42380 [Planotetraspora silvatica]|uniref:Uncharacterized protein n=1 Tax=Planotetraspora silvatica TaxID=234614 RepID=A0A8J3UL30_9ACTN|nr:hypothetical protein Psi02_42380 [Planotetraspora silvatica]